MAVRNSVHRTALGLPAILLAAYGLAVCAKSASSSWVVSRITLPYTLLAARKDHRQLLAAAVFQRLLTIAIFFRAQPGLQHQLVHLGMGCQVHHQIGPAMGCYDDQRL